MRRPCSASLARRSWTPYVRDWRRQPTPHSCDSSRSAGAQHRPLYYGDSFTIACPTGSGHLMNFFEVAKESADRLSPPLPARCARSAGRLPCHLPRALTSYADFAVEEGWAPSHRIQVCRPGCPAGPAAQYACVLTHAARPLPRPWRTGRAWQEGEKCWIHAPTRSWCSG
jgi:hypothetical protein